MRIDGLITAQPQNIQGIGDILGKLEIGDIVKAKILEITSGEVLLKAFEGATFKAATAVPLDARPGDTLELVVNGRADGKLFMETVKQDGTGKNAGIALKLQLESLSLPPDETNLELAANLKASGQTVSRNLIDNAVALMRQFSQLSAGNAAFLASNGIHPTAQDSSSLMNLLEGKLKIGNGLNELSKQLSTLAGQISDLSENGLDKLPQGGSNRPEGLNAANNTAFANKASDPGQSNNSGRLNQFISENLSDLENAVPGKGNSSIPSNQPEAGNPDNFAGLGKGTAKSDGNLINKFFEEAGFQRGKESENTLFSDIKKELPDAGPLSGKVHQNKDGELSPEKAKESARTAVKILKEAGELFVKVESDSLKSDMELKKVFSNMIDKLDNLKELLQSSSLQGRDELLNKLSMVEDNIRLLNQVGNNTLYAQIPVNIHGFNTTAEIFVMKREARKTKLDPGNAVLFLSLDTHNIGTVQSIVEIKGKNVGVNLRAEMPEIIDYMKDNMSGLYNSLTRSGYKLVDVRYRLITEPAGLAGMEKAVREELFERRKGVDLRI